MTMAIHRGLSGKCRFDLIGSDGVGMLPKSRLKMEVTNFKIINLCGTSLSL